MVLLFEAKDLGKARAFAKSEDLRQAMERAGVVDQPDIYFLDEPADSSWSACGGGSTPSR